MSADTESTPRPTVTTSFSGYDPPFDPVPIVRRMLDSVAGEYLVGLGEVVLTNSSGLPRRLRRGVTKSRARKVHIASARGLYHQEWQGRPAWIEIFVDNTLKGWERGLWLGIPFLREGQIADVLFHEIGHHIHFAVRPEFREREDVADVWMVRLRRNYYRQRFPWISRVVRLLWPVLKRSRAWAMARLLKSGSISRAEYDESLGTSKSTRSH